MFDIVPFTLWLWHNIHFVAIKVACTSGQIFEKIMKRYPIFSVQIINYQIDQMHK